MKSLKLILLSLVTTQMLLAGTGDDWMESYYKSPTPDKFIAEVRSMTNEGGLKKGNAQPPVVAFLSRLMASNPKEISKWLGEFTDLDEKQRTVLLAAAWYSDTEEARTFFKDHKLETYLKQKAPDVVEMEVNNPATLDMLWGYFLATGAEKPIRRIVSALDLSKHAGALDKFKTSEKTDQNRKEAYLDVTFQAARWSLESNSRQHPQVLKYCESILGDPNLPKNQSLWLGVVLSKVKPDQYSIEIEKDKGEPGDPH